MLRSDLAILCTAVVVAAAVPQSLAAAGDQGRVGIRFALMDANRDGEISREEWRGSARSFAVYDWNGDGKLSGDEIRVVGPQRGTDFSTVDHDPSVAERYLSYTQAGFQNLDHNRDNRVTRNEWHYDIETFRRIDADRDNALTQVEFLGIDNDDLRGDRFDDIDVDNDGRVVRGEWYGSAASFERFDQNRDGVLNRYEVVGGENYTDDSWDQFTNLDHDGNGAVSRDEWHWSATSFTARDLNRDGRLTRQELSAAGGTPRGGSAAASSIPPRTVRVDAKRRWTDTGVDVQAGDLITFNSTGTIQMGGADDNALPAGSTIGRKAPEAPILNQPAGALIAQVGDFGPIFVGNRRQIRAPVSGRLYLGVNDDYLGDNAGEFVVAVGRAVGTP